MSHYREILDSVLASSRHDTIPRRAYSPLSSVVYDGDVAPNVVVHIPNQHKQSLYNRGLELIKERKVAIAILAGGQGTRLSGGIVKALAQVTPIKRKTLLQLMFEKLAKIFSVCAVTKGHPLVYILTSSCTRDAIVKALESNDYYGLDKDSIVILLQPNLPCFTIQGHGFIKYPRLIEGVSAQAIDGEVVVATTPNGNGAIYSALADNAVFLKHLHGLKWLHVVGVDNCLCRPLDPEYLGFADAGDTFDACCKCIEAKVGEELGIFCKDNDTGKVTIVEYSEVYKFSPETFEKLQASKLYGNVCDHVFSGRFLRRFLTSGDYKQMPFHAARKQVVHWDCNEGKLVHAKEPNAYKLEYFVFDALHYCSNVSCMLVDRNESFLPVKRAVDLQTNNHEDDNGTSVQAGLTKVYKQWLSCNLPGKCEVSPLVSYAGEGLDEFRGKVSDLPKYIG